MALDGIGNGNSGYDFYSSMFGTANTTASGGSNILGDYSLIQSGAYKKLLKAYYAKEEAEETEENEPVDSSVDLLNTKANAENLNNALAALTSKSLYESTGTDENGKDVYDNEKITGAVKQFVESYNAYLDSAGDLDSTSILRKTLSMVKATSGNANLLREIGITIGEGNKLVLDEEKLGKAAVTTINSLFAGHGSYGDRIQMLAGESYKLANSQAYTNNHASSYTYDGTYSILGTSNGTLDKYL